jgi:DMSO/TMAO reductase YedYZ molybdopterin-dependent catalytic subunit
LKRAGVLAGAIGALTMTAFFFVAQLVAGISTPSELFADVSAPYIPVHLFGILIGIAGGYTPLKILGFVSVVVGQFAVGIAGGILLSRVAERRRIPAAATLVAVLWLVSAIGFWPVLVTSYVGLPPGPARVLTSLALFAGYVAYVLTTLAILRAASARQDGSRRSFIAGGAGLAAAAAVGSGAALATRTVFGYDGTTYEGPDVVAITPVSRFYVVTKNTIDPKIELGLWRLSVGGAVANRFELSFEDLAKRSKIAQETTLMCINNPPDGGLMSNALWGGVRLRDLLAEAGPASEAKLVAFHSADNIIEAIPYAKALDPTTLVAYEMNGAPLPVRHGFPARAVVPGFFGEKNIKWLTRITVETALFEDFYGKQGWGPNEEIPTHARFDAPDFSKPLTNRLIELRGIGFCGDRGVARIEVSFDGGLSWRGAQFTSPYNPLTWRLWRYSWTPDRAGTYQLAVRATDSRGNVQTSKVHGAETNGATGLDRVTAHVV